MASSALFVVRRLGIAALVWLSTLAAFGLFHAGVPDRAADAQLNAQLGPGKPITWQYLHYLVRLLHGDLGQSLVQGLSVDALLWRALPPTLSLMIGGVVLWLELSAYLNRSGLLWLQSGYVPLTHNPGAWLILRRHVLRPAIIPVITTAAAGFGTLLGAAAIVDQTFALNGIGQALLTAVKTGDLMTIMGTVLITVILICLASLLADIAQKILDPRSPEGATESVTSGVAEPPVLPVTPGVGVVGRRLAGGARVLVPTGRWRLRARPVPHRWRLRCRHDSIVGAFAAVGLRGSRGSGAACDSRGSSTGWGSGTGRAQGGQGG
jgi:hypothetical protein